MISFSQKIGIVCLLLILFFSIYRIQIDQDRTKIRLPPRYTPNTFLIGNSHSHPILIDGAFYLNEDGAHLNDRVSQLHVAKELNSKAVIISNIAPIEIFWKSSGLLFTKYNTYVYPDRVYDLVNKYEAIITRSPTSLFKDNENSYFNQYGRRIVISNQDDKDWERLAHYKNNFFATEETINKNIDFLYDLSAKNKEMIFITMPHHQTYIKNLIDKTRSLGFEKPRDFTDLLSKSISGCYINLFDYQLEDKYYLDGDHLNEEGAKYIKPAIAKHLNDCGISIQ